MTEIFSASTLWRMWCVLVAALFLFLPRLALSQCNNDQDPQFSAGPKGGSIEVNPNEISAGFAFIMEYDSSRTLYRVADFHLNQNRINLLSWCLGQEILGNSDQLLRDSSRTEAMALATGDTIRFIRDLSWFNPQTREQTPSNYWSLDTLDYVVELVNVLTGNRMALLDSIGILRTPIRTVPTVYGLFALMEEIQYVVPSTFHGTSARIYIRPIARGNGPHYFGRSDRWAIGLFKRLNDSLWNAYLSAFGATLGLKRAVDGRYNEDITTYNALITLNVSPNPSSGLIKIDFDPASDGRVTRVVIFDEQGRKVYVPAYVPKTKGGLQSVEYHQDKPGTYFVVLYHGETIVRNVQVVVRP